MSLIVAAGAWWLLREVRAPDGASASPLPRAPAAEGLLPPPLPVESADPSLLGGTSSALPPDAGNASSSADPSRLLIVVVDERCELVPGARIELWLEEADDWEEGQAPLSVLETDAAGRCVLPGNAATVLVATREGVGSSGYVYLAGLARSVTISGEAVVRLLPRSRLRGRVIEADDRPAPGVLVNFWLFGGPGGRPPDSLHTAPDGGFDLEVDANTLLGLAALDGGRRSNEVRFATEPRGEREVLLRLRGDWSVGGIVFSSRAEPLPGVKVTLWRNIPEWFLPRAERPDILPNSWFEATITGLDGRFVFEVRERLTYTLIAQAPGELPTPAVEALIDERHDHAFVELHVPEPSFIAGRVVDPSGVSIADVTVLADTGTMWSMHDRLYEPWPKDRWGDGGSARTDARGDFRIQGLHPDGWYRVGLKGAARDMRRPDPATDVHAGRSDVIIVHDAQLAEPLSVTFGVRATSGASLVPDATVTVYRLFDEGELVAQLKRESLPDGRQRFIGFREDDRYSAMVEAEGLATVDVPAWIASPEFTDIDVLLPRPATLDVEVRRSGGEPAAWADCRIAPVQPRHDMLGHLWRDADGLGRTRFADIDPGQFHVTVRAGGHETSQDVELGDGESRSVQVVLPD